VLLTHKVDECLITQGLSGIWLGIGTDETQGYLTVQVVEDFQGRRVVAKEDGPEPIACPDNTVCQMHMQAYSASHLLR